MRDKINNITRIFCCTGAESLGGTIDIGETYEVLRWVTSSIRILREPASLFEACVGV